MLAGLMNVFAVRSNFLDFTRLVIFVELDPGEFWRHWVKVIFELDLSNDFAPKN